MTDRTTIFISHAAPQDNEFALWLASKLAIAGYHVWIDRRRLTGGDDSWDEIERVLRHEAIKQIVVFTQHSRKPGVKKELAIGDAVRTKIGDSKFMIGIRNDETAFGDAPPELLRGNMLDAGQNWHDCLEGLFDALSQSNVPRTSHPQTSILQNLVDAREHGRRFTVAVPEEALSNWFSVTPPGHLRYFRFEGLQEQVTTWLRDCKIPYVQMGRLAGTFADERSFVASSSFEQSMPLAYDIPLMDCLSGHNLGPYRDRQDASKDVVNLLRQHFDVAAEASGLKPVQFASRQVGWFFPDGLVSANKIVAVTPNGRRIRRSVSGRFKNLRWHLCIIAKPRIWPTLVYRIHGNVVLSEDGQTLLPGDKTHARRRRLTRSWWNDVWRDRLLAAMSFLAGGSVNVPLSAGETHFQVSTWPLTALLPVSYTATDPPLPSEEDDEGNITPSVDLDEGQYEDTETALSDRDTQGDDGARAT